MAMQNNQPNQMSLAFAVLALVTLGAAAGLVMMLFYNNCISQHFCAKSGEQASLSSLFMLGGAAAAGVAAMIALKCSKQDRLDVETPALA